jgi:hypothetical protein
MKAPDKIWVREFAEGVNQMWSHIKATKTSAIAQHEYIRKDALLEKLEKVAAEYKKRSDEGELVWQNMCGINLAIDILNKM